MTSQTSTKKCPFCAEQIQSDAKKCRFCHELLDDEMRKQKESAAQKQSSPGIAAVLSLIFPGAGQMYRGQIMEGFFWLIFCVIGYAIFFPIGIVLHIFCIVKAHNPKANFNKKLW